MSPFQVHELFHDQFLVLSYTGKRVADASDPTAIGDIVAMCLVLNSDNPRISFMQKTMLDMAPISECKYSHVQLLDLLAIARRQLVHRIDSSYPIRKKELIKKLDACDGWARTSIAKVLTDLCNYDDAHAIAKVMNDESGFPYAMSVLAKLSWSENAE